MEPILQLLKRTMGLDATSIGLTMIHQAVRLRMQHLEIVQTEDYARRLGESPTELSALVEAVVVKETWFFRDKEPFTALVRMVQEEHLPTHAGEPLRLLSVPCSTGEEPYSMAMALLDAGLPMGQFQIDALDISAHALDYARGAVYRRNSFRGSAHDFRERHFEATDAGYLLHPKVRAPVHFQQGNVLDDQCLKEHKVYDYVFCRNLLIYFDRPTQDRVLQKLHRVLKKSGVLFVGPVELPLVNNHGFTSARISMAAACRKVESTPKPRPGSSHPVRKFPIPAPQRQLNPTFPKADRQAPAKGDSVAKPTAVNVRKSPPAALEKAARLADAGQLDEAARACQECIRVHGASATAYYLLGLVRDAAGKEAQAMDFYRKALYLEPNHYDSLVQMATLTGKQGDAKGARRLHQRAQRVLKT